jgi:hypothetical protein
MQHGSIWEWVRATDRRLGSGRAGSVVNGDGTVEVLADEHPALGHAEAERLPLDLKLDLAEGDDVVVTDNSLVMFGKHFLKLVACVGNKAVPGSATAT